MLSTDFSTKFCTQLIQNTHILITLENTSAEKKDLSVQSLTISMALGNITSLFPVGTGCPQHTIIVTKLIGTSNFSYK